MMDCYAVLGVSPDASQEEIKEAFRERALECHPDRAAEGEERAAEEEFVRVRKAFETLSDPETRAAYDAADEEGTDAPDTVDEMHVRRRSYKKAWRDARRGGPVSVSRVILDKVGGQSADYKVIERRTSQTVPLCALAGTLLYVAEPGAIYATDVFLLDLALCAVMGGICGFVLGNAWGYTDLLLGRENT
jgi:hypothetical protein